jgi:hypothetical protein
VIVSDIESVAPLAPRRAPPHVHRCPECYEAWPCGADCAIEPDLALDNGLPCGAYCVCPSCEKGGEVR